MKPNTTIAETALMSVCNHIKTQVQTVDRVMERFVGVIVILSGCVWPQTIEHWNDQVDRYQRPWRRALPPRVVWEQQSIAEDGAQRGARPSSGETSSHALLQDCCPAPVALPWDRRRGLRHRPAASSKVICRDPFSSL